MKIFAKTSIVIAGFLAVPLLASAQSVHTSAGTQQSFLSELQSLQQELSALAATISAMIAAAGGAPSSTQPSSPITSAGSLLPLILPAALGSLPADGSSDEDFSSELLQAIAPSVSTTTFIAIPSAATTSGIDSTSAVVSQSNVSQFDPACLSSLFADNAQCGGLYYCSAQGGYWSSSACSAN